MDDIQFWLYILFAIIYFVARALKKKSQPDTDAQAPDINTETSRRSRPKSFEELLQEFTEGKESVKEEVKQAEQDVEDFREVREVKSTEDVSRRVQKEISTETLFEEGTTRSFSDEESRRVYEESIKRAEGAAIEFKDDASFKSKLKSRQHQEEDEHSLAMDIKHMLSNPEDAKKAVIMGDILNRKY